MARGQEKSFVYIYDKLIGCVIRIPNQHEVFEAKWIRKISSNIQTGAFSYPLIDFQVSSKLCGCNKKMWN